MYSCCLFILFVIALLFLCLLGFEFVVLGWLWFCLPCMLVVLVYLVLFVTLCLGFVMCCLLCGLRRFVVYVWFCYFVWFCFVGCIVVFIVCYFVGVGCAFAWVFYWVAVLWLFSLSVVCLGCLDELYCCLR